METVENVQAMTHADLVRWHKDHFVPDGAILAIAGDVDAKTLKPELQKAFAAWKRGTRPPVKKQVEPKLKGITVRLIDKPDLTQFADRDPGELGIAHGDARIISRRSS